MFACFVLICVHLCLACPNLAERSVCVCVYKCFIFFLHLCVCVYVRVRIGLYKHMLHQAVVHLAKISHGNFLRCRIMIHDLTLHLSTSVSTSKGIKFQSYLWVLFVCVCFRTTNVLYLLYLSLQVLPIFFFPNSQQPSPKRRPPFPQHQFILIHHFFFFFLPSL